MLKVRSAGFEPAHYFNFQIPKMKGREPAIPHCTSSLTPRFKNIPKFAILINFDQMRIVTIVKHDYRYMVFLNLLE
ncbi:hypothetical protein BH23THE1_BH23THE1_21010 [soil metagenome]